MTGTMAVTLAAQIALGFLVVAMLLVIVRLIRGPNLGDRILALDTIMTLSIGFIAAAAVLTGFSLYIDIAIAIALVGFLSTIALARYLLGSAGKERRR
ncbi:monovalent cation/H+ antiporter complex subunit F [Devosia sp.]|uniref:monovalent cation/H+ antiporter complex subunit F n=1 Tax=Devosia sp. TaxID=1871048 RepID=UPI0035B35AFC